MLRLENKVALITGATGGLGSAVTRTFLSAGATVAGSSTSVETAGILDPNFTPLRARLSSLAAARSLVDEVLAKLHRIDILVHVVGGFAGGKPVAQTDDTTLEQMLDLNLRTLFHAVRAVVPHMRKQGSGRIVAVGGRAAVDPQPVIGAYSASKAAMLSLVQTLALENKDRQITANVVLPATMDTPANRAGDPGADFTKWVPTEKVASVILWLASDAASHVNGAAIPVYG
jgi:NAD(P)-dependent dehydrogenase (short-subunit alcohol dehydrogenase family)